MSSRETLAATQAAEAYALVQADPRRALALAERAAAAADLERNPRAKVAALYALSWAQLELGDGRALATARAGVRLARWNGDRRGEGLLRRRVATSLAFDGRLRAARREIDAALELLSSRDRAESEVFRVFIHRRSNLTDQEAYDRMRSRARSALRILRRDGEALWEARLLFNLAMLQLDHGALDDAEASFRRAHALYTSSGARAAAVDVSALLAEVARQRGDILGCLRTLDQARAELVPGRPSHNFACYLAAGLTEARLLGEARAAAQAYVDLCARTGYADEVAKTTLDLAALAIMAGDTAAARSLAARVRRSCAGRGKAVDAALARLFVLRTRVLDGSAGRPSVRTGLAIASFLDTAGRTRDAARARVLTARAAIAAGSLPTARRQLALASPLAGGTAAERIELLHVRALLQLAVGDPREAARLLRLGLRLVEDYRDALGALDLRTTASGVGSGLAELGLRMALETGDSEQVLEWAERLRANALRLRPVRPPADPELRRLQTELRSAAGRREAGAHGLARQQAHQARLETAIRARARVLAGERRAAPPRTATRELARNLGSRVLVEYIALDRRLAAITLAAGRLDLHDLGPDNLADEIDWLRVALARLARRDTTPVERQAAAASGSAAAATLDRRLLEPLAEVTRDAELVVVPTGQLHALAWGALPSLRGRALTVAPSATTWSAQAARPRSRRRKAVLVAGPRLRHATTEVREIAALRPRATVLTGSGATSGTTLAALDGAALAHLACHGRFRSDSPLFSALELADGPLNVYDLQRLAVPPDVVVLSACDIAGAEHHPGDELLGLSAALLGLGTRTIIASVVPVADTTARRLMVALHRELAAGRPPAAALATAQSKSSVPGFVCLGYG
jgi:hypothetical protein